MPTRHRVTQGECLTTIAEKHGFFWEALWNHPDNEALRAPGRHPNVLRPGEVVTIPDKTVSTYARPTGARHTWRVKGVPLKLRLRLTWDGEPRRSEPFTLTVEGAVTRGTTDGDGRIDLTIPTAAAEGTLVVGEGEREETFSLNLGHLDPVEDDTGVGSRLANLGFEVRAGDAGSLRDAVRSFQNTEGLDPTGEVDNVTRSRILAAHDPE